jgi:hypothetical protein
VCGLRPAFPDFTPSEYRALAEACWQADPEKRCVFLYVRFVRCELSLRLWVHIACCVLACVLGTAEACWQADPRSSIWRVWWGVIGHGLRCMGLWVHVACCLGACLCLAVAVACQTPAKPPLSSIYHAVTNSVTPRL